MRGKPRTRNADAIDEGITPADAGKTFVNSFISLILWDHPRGCGENITTCCSAHVSRGSPPRMRGKPY